jgi:alkylation response protein AidB-like acyl-CoA dehydrogenase
MYDYKAPIRDIRFAMNDVLNYPDHYAALPNGQDASPEIVDAILSEFGKFCENGYKEAYKLFAEAGWPSLSSEVEMGGQGLPASLSKVITEMLGSASIGFTLYTAGQSGAIETLSVYGDEHQRNLYERRLVDGSWNATMCLTEPHCGTDLGLLKTKATPQPDGSYRLSGTKIFITGGEHDLTENIVHIVLARLPDAPMGTKGISLFIVPKFHSDSDGNLKERNNVNCGSIEHKMGANASATCVMNIDDATGYLLGEPNKGLKAMFTFMNAARIATATQGVAHAELGYQKSAAYARDRLQMRSLKGPQNPDGPADPIIVHPDVRRMLLTQKVFAEGNRYLILFLSQKLDVSLYSDDPTQRQLAQSQLDFMTPIAKAFATETGCESANLAMQCFGGHGYIREWGLEQNVRDARISTLYEGTTGIQALDLLSRKVLGTNGAMLQDFTQEIEIFCEDHRNNENVANLITQLEGLVIEWKQLTQFIAEKAAKDVDEIGAASVNYLMYSGYICLAYLWTKAATVSSNMIETNTDEIDFYKSKINLANFYFDHILPRTHSCKLSIKAGANSLMSPREDEFKVW